MSDISRIPLSNHEIFQAKALAKKYDEAAKRALSDSRRNDNIPEWIALSAMKNFIHEGNKLERAIANGDAFDVRIELQFPLELPENELPENGEAV